MGDSLVVEKHGKIVVDINLYNRLTCIRTSVQSDMGEKRSYRKAPVNAIMIFKVQI